MSEEQNFLSRWARRKEAHRQQQTVSETVLEKPASPPEPQLPAHQSSELLAQPDAAAKAVEPSLGMEDVAALTSESDFAPFVAKSATELVKNAALKKLFSDPHFNIMDRLDIYIDDYSQPDPLPEGWLDQLEHAKGWLTPTDAQRAASKEAAEQAAAEQSALAITQPNPTPESPDLANSDVHKPTEMSKDSYDNNEPHKAEFGLSGHSDRTDN